MGDLTTLLISSCRFHFTIFSAPLQLATLLRILSEAARVQTVVIDGLDRTIDIQSPPTNPAHPRKVPQNRHGHNCEKSSKSINIQQGSIAVLHCVRQSLHAQSCILLVTFTRFPGSGKGARFFHPARPPEMEAKESTHGILNLNTMQHCPPQTFLALLVLQLHDHLPTSI